MDRWHSPIAEYLQWLTAAGKSPDTVRLRRKHLWRLARACQGSPWTVTLDDLTEFMAVEHWLPETRRSMQSTIQTFYRWATRTGRLASSPAEYLATIAVSVGEPNPAPETVLLAAIERAKPRDRRMLMLGAYAGLRRAEISRVHSHHIVESRLYVYGKGRRERMVPLHPILLAELVAQPAGYLFPGKVDGHLSADRVGVVMAALLGDGWTAHTLRHRFATKAYAIERDMLAVQKLLGHSSPVTTMRYTLLPPDAMNRAVLGAGPLAA